MTIIILIIIYIISVLLMWLYFHLAYSKNGVFKSIDAECSDLIIVLIPLLNTFGVFYLYLIEPPIEKECNCNKFFKVKK